MVNDNSENCNVSDDSDNTIEDILNDSKDNNDKDKK